MNIKTDRMIIRDFTMNDINDMQDILGDAETMKNCEPAYTIEKTADFLQKFCIEKKGAVAAIRKDTAKVIGYILFNEFNDGVYEIGWFFNRAFWRQGFAYESCKAVIDYALRRWTKGYTIKQPNMDCQPTEITALMRHRAVFS